MTPTRVLLVYHNPLFAHSVRVALEAEASLDLVEELDDWSRVHAEIARLAPDVVLVEEDEGSATDAMLGDLRASQAPWRVVAMRLDETTMHVWSGSGKVLKKPEDLYNALRTLPESARNSLRTVSRQPPAHGGR